MILMIKLNKSGFSIIEIVAALVVLILISAIAIIQISGYRVSTEQKLHVLSASNFVGAVQNSQLRGDIGPLENGIHVITLADMITLNPTFELKNPSEASQTYDDSSSVSIHHSNGYDHYTIILKGQISQVVYINGTKMGELHWKDIIIN